MQRLRPLTTLFIIHGFVPWPRSNDYSVVVVLGPAAVGRLVQKWVCGKPGEAYLLTVEDAPPGTGLRPLRGRVVHHHQRPPPPRPAARHLCQGLAFRLFYSVFKKQTLAELKPLCELICDIIGNNLQKCPIMLVGNKRGESSCELTVWDDAASDLEWNCASVETSTKMNNKVQELFHMLLNHEKPATCLQPPQKKSQMLKTTDQLLGIT